MSVTTMTTPGIEERTAVEGNLKENMSLYDCDSAMH